MPLVKMISSAEATLKPSLSSALSVCFIAIISPQVSSDSQRQFYVTGTGQSEPRTLQ
jgi:hypothetical protein